MALFLFPVGLTAAQQDTTSYLDQSFPRLAGGVTNSPITISIAPTIPRWKKFMAVCFQGLANRKRGEVYLIWDQSDSYWTNNWKQVGYSFNPNFHGVDEIPAIVQSNYPNRISGILLYDEAIINQTNWSQLINVYTAIATEENLLPVPTSHRSDFAFLSVLFDAQNKWASEADGYRWAITNYPDLTSNRPLAYQHPSCLRERDYYVAHRIMPIFYWNGMPSWLETDFRNAIKNTGPNQIVIGLWNVPTWNDSGFEERGKPSGIHSEHDLIELLSPYGKGFVATAERGVANLSYQSGMIMMTNTWRHPPRTPPPLDNSKVYVALVISDGDNIGYVQWYDLLTSSRWWKDPAHGSIPINWTLTPALSRMMPGVMSYLYQTANTNDCFIGADTGYAYMLPRVFGDAYPNREELHRVWHKRTAEMLAEVDMKCLQYVFDYDSAGPLDSLAVRELNYLAQESSPHVQLKGLMLDYGLRIGVNKNNAEFMIGGIPSFQSLTMGGGFSEDAFVAQIVTNTPPVRPAFIQVFCETWQFTPSKLQSIAAKLSTNYLLVDAEELGDLYIQSGQCANPGNLGASCLAAGNYLKTGEYLLSPSGNCFGLMQTDGNFAIYKGSGPLDNHGFVWSTGSSTNDNYFAIMQPDRNFAIYRGVGPADNRGFVWQSGTAGGVGNCFLSLQNDWSLVINQGTGLTNIQSLLWQNGVSNAPPNIAITGPINGAKFDEPANILITVTANDPVPSNAVSRVEFYQNAHWLGISSNAPFAFQWSNTLGGIYQLTAKAYDQDGVPKLSATVEVTVKPKLSIAMDGNHIQLCWANPGFRLQQKETLPLGSWQDIVGTETTNAIKLPTTGSAMYFQLVKQ